MPRFELLNFANLSQETNILTTDRNYIGPSFTFRNDSVTPAFTIGKTTSIPSNQLILSFNYNTNAPFSSFSPYILVNINDVFVGAANFTSSNGSKTLFLNINDSVLSTLNLSVSEINYDIVRIDFNIPTGSSITTTSISDLTLSWNTSKTETFVNYENTQGDLLQTFGSYNNYPYTWNINPVQLNSFNFSYRNGYYYKVDFSGVTNEAFDLVSRAIVRVTGSNNNSLSGINENPCVIEAYCVNRELSDVYSGLNTQEGKYNQEGDVYAWGSSNLISYSGNQSNDIELCFVKKNNSHPFKYSANKFGRDHKSLFTKGDFYLKGLTSGYQINNVELLLYNKNDEYIPFSMFGGNDVFTSTIVNVSDGYTSTRKLMTEDYQFWWCGSGSSSGVEPSGLESSGLEPPPPSLIDI